MSRALPSGAEPYTHQGAVTHSQLDYYLDEFAFRFDRRHSRHRDLLFYRLIQGGLAADPHPYATLITPPSAPQKLLPAHPRHRCGRVG